MYKKKETYNSMGKLMGEPMNVWFKGGDKQFIALTKYFYFFVNMRINGH